MILHDSQGFKEHWTIDFPLGDLSILQRNAKFG
jgi:hypothetical protein